MFRVKKDEFHCLLCRQTYIKRVNGKTLYLPVEKDVEFEADFEV
tara:strand:- start:662 stop:793 length:132 start_codon:yes stop_codon:yes gene_type:complete